jgi:hypothetical protein
MRKLAHPLIWAAALLLAGATGCDSTFSPGPPYETPPPAPPLNDTPGGAIKRLVWVYENKQAANYENLFTGDFAFEFSAAADPLLAQYYASGWLKLDETTSARHLFQGFTNDSTGYHPPATSIDLTFNQTIPTDDTDGRDPAKFKVLATRVDGVIVVPPTGSETEPTRYVIDNNFHRFFLVRGDAAAGLGAEQPADSTHWYVYRWIDETAQPVAPSGVSSKAGQNSSWGGLKASYR